MNEDAKIFLFAVTPVVIAMFFCIALTLICPWTWVTAAVQIPVWLVMIWWVYALRGYYDILDT